MAPLAPPRSVVGFLVAAPHSGSGKTVVTTGLIAALAARGHSIHPAKVGPDYIDPTFLSAAAGRPAVNLDLWAMRPALLDRLAAREGLVVEGVMGLFDGPQEGAGSSADVAARLGLPVVLVVDASRQSQSIAALAHGFATFDTRIDLAGVILTKVASPRHETMLRGALERAGIVCFGAVRRDAALALPSRHLGLVTAPEANDLAARIAAIGAILAADVDLTLLEALERRAASLPPEPAAPLPPPGQRIAIAADVAFSFAYAHLADGWRAAGAEIAPFSPLAGDAPDKTADAIVLPGGYPELHAAHLSANSAWRDGLAQAAGRGALIYGECGGYMALGETLIDGDGVAHPMAGLLPITTSFAERRRSLGYRELTHEGEWLPRRLAGHEFHYATIAAEGPPLFTAADSAGAALGKVGTRIGRVMGSFIHLIDRR